jgi:hypothetical protein
MGAVNNPGNWISFTSPTMHNDAALANQSRHRFKEHLSSSCGQKNFASSPDHSDLIRFFPTSTDMSGIASNSLRQASRLCLKQPASAAGLLRSSTTARVAGISQNSAKRRYVSATTKDSAQVNVDTAIRAEQKAFFAETGKLPETQIIPGSGVNADAMMSPMAGMLLKHT